MDEHSDTVQPSTPVRVCVGQYALKSVTNWEQIVQQVEDLVQQAAAGNSQFLVLPEMFTAQMFSCMPSEWSDRQMVEALAGQGEKYRQMFMHLAKRYQLYLIGGSQPVIQPDGCLYNVAHLFSPGGGVYTQPKLHITPKEARLWQFVPGKVLRIFETPVGRVALQICYDIEFPESSRLLALAGAQILFVPFNTEDERGCLRVKACAQSRAIENYIYTAIAGLSGSLPLPAYSHNYAHSAIFGPSDMIFHSASLLAESEPNRNMVIFADLNLDQLAELRKLASVHPLEDRNLLAYELHACLPIEVIQTD